MKISFSFSCTKDLSDLSYGEKLLEILFFYGLIPDKVGKYEPIRKDFVASDLPEYWKLNRPKSDMKCTSLDFMFKGKAEIRFIGMVICDVNLHPNSRATNGFALWLTTPKRYDINKLVSLGDDLFAWSVADYGYVTEESKNIAHTMIPFGRGNKRSLGGEGISGLMWLNYFGKPYLAEKDFKLPYNHTLVGHGARIRLTERPDDEALGNLDINKKYQEIIGKQWFWPFEKIENGVGWLPHDFKKSDIVRPYFDRSEITRAFQ